MSNTRRSVRRTKEQSDVVQSIDAILKEQHVPREARRRTARAQRNAALRYIASPDKQAAEDLANFKR